MNYAMAINMSQKMLSKIKKEHKVIGRIVGSRKEHGKSRVLVHCLGCGICSWVYLWSYAGSGKRCNGCKFKLEIIP